MLQVRGRKPSLFINSRQENLRTSIRFQVQEETVVVCFKAFSRLWLERTGKNHEKTPVRIADISAEFKPQTSENKCRVS
jgi:hypothetical protein